jgi:hypothetical protein
MLTEEQIENLKPGDPIVIHGNFTSVDKERDIWARVGGRTLWFSTESVSLPSEIVNSQSSIVNKHDPCRLFKKGDKVRIVEYKGRHTGYDKKIYKVCEDEEESGRYIKLSLDGYIGHFTVDAAYLELLIPVEELEPYFIYESKEEESFDIMKRVGKLHLTRNCIYFKTEINDHAELTREEALAAAEAERDRLNAEWRKEHENED